MEYYINQNISVMNTFDTLKNKIYIHNLHFKLTI